MRNCLNAVKGKTQHIIYDEGFKYDGSREMQDLKGSYWLDIEV